MYARRKGVVTLLFIQPFTAVEISLNVIFHLHHCLVWDCTHIKLLMHQYVKVETTLLYLSTKFFCRQATGNIYLLWLPKTNHIVLQRIATIS